ncbi:MAG: hypothetical protein Q8O86_00120 [Dehalococcoidia bacterium]|nr:hypothetical protein [Dehalococcoidia bacterium]
MAILGLPLEMDDIREAAASFDRQVDEAVARNPELAQYVRQLEIIADKPQEAPEEMPSPEAIVKDLEEYLRRKGKERKNGEQTGPDS